MRVVRRVLRTPMFWYHWCQALQELRELTKEARKYDAMLESGEWDIVYKHPNVLLLRHRRAGVLPDSLKVTAERLWPDRRSRTISAKMLDRVSPSSFVVRTRQVDARFSATVMMIRRSGKVVLFDVATKRVYKKMPVGEDSIEYRKLKSHIASVYRVPKTTQDGEFECESLEGGEYYGDLPFSCRKRVLQVIAEHSLTLKNATGHASCADLMGLGFRIASAHVTDAEVRSYIENRRDRVLEAAKLWPLIPAHRDLTAHNILIASSQPVLLDLSPRKVGWAPVFFDCLCLVHSEALEYERCDLLQSYIHGELDGIIEPLWRDSNMLGDLNRKDVLLAETLCMAAMKVKLSGNAIEHWLRPILELDDPEI